MSPTSSSCMSLSVPQSQRGMRTVTSAFGFPGLTTKKKSADKIDDKKPKGTIAMKTKQKPALKMGKGTSMMKAKEPAAKKSGGGGLFGFGTKMGKGTSMMKAKEPAASAKKSGGGGLFGFGTKKQAAPEAKKAAPAASKTVVKQKKMLSRMMKAPSGKPAVTKGGKSSGIIDADARRGGARKNKYDAKKEVSRWYGKDRSLYLPSGLLTEDEVPDWLDGTLAGDYGFDPLELGKTKDQVEKYREAELLHARWAMLAVPGVFFPEALGVKGGTWFETGKVALTEGLDYTAPPIFAAHNPLPLPIIVAAQVGLMGLVEKYRTDPDSAPTKGWAPVFGKWEDVNPFQGLDQLSPGGPLNPFGAATKAEEDMKLMKVREIKNGRIAMIAMLGVFIQGAVTGEGCYANWSKHVADPFGYNLLTLFNQDMEFTVL